MLSLYMVRDHSFYIVLPFELDITLADSGDEDEQANPAAGPVAKLSGSADPDTIMVISSSEDEDPNPPKRQR